MKLKLLKPTYSICKLSPDNEVPSWALTSSTFFLSKTSDELSIICPATEIPSEVKVSNGWRCIRVDGDLEFDEIGVVTTVSSPIANKGISLFLVSTHDRDYVLIHKDDLDNAISEYEKKGFSIVFEN